MKDPKDLYELIQAQDKRIDLLNQRLNIANKRATNLYEYIINMPI
jgi:hypothetical protein